jgi:SAM-dependent methyltransferase
MLEFKDIYSNSSALKSRSTVNNNLSTHDLDEWLINLLPPLSGKEILDLGCGNGKQIFKIESLNNNKILGVDISPESVNSIKEKVQLLKNNKISACVASMDNVLDVVKETFDIILSTYAIYYSKNQLNLINSLKSLLNKNGVILISGPGKFSNKEIIDLMNSLDGENKIDTVDDFINIDDINRLKDTYEKVETFRLNNFVNFDNYINVNNWWKNHSIYKKELDKEFTDYLKKHFKKNKLFSITKNILAIKIYV